MDTCQIFAAPADGDVEQLFRLTLADVWQKAWLEFRLQTRAGHIEVLAALASRWLAAAIQEPVMPQPWCAAACFHRTLQQPSSCISGTASVDHSVTTSGGALSRAVAQHCPSPGWARPYHQSHRICRPAEGPFCRLCASAHAAQHC